MIFSVGIILAAGLFAGKLFRRLHLPEIIGVMLSGIVLGPYGFNVLDDGFLAFSGEIRTLAFIIILLKAGLMLDLQILKKVGRSAILLCFVPATMEMLAYALFAPPLLGISAIEAGIIGAIMGAVSPAIVVPRMTKLIEDGWGTDKGIPQMIVAGASADDVYVIVLFSSFLALAGGNGFHVVDLARIPLSILFGIAIGTGIGFLSLGIFERVQMRATQKCLMLLAFSFLLVAIENTVSQFIPFSGYLAVIAMGVVIPARRPQIAHRAADKLSKLWVGAESFLFVMVGAAADPRLALKAGLPLLGMIFIGLAFRLFGVWLCVLRTSLHARERFFVLLAEIPKATVQAAIGSIPLAMGLSCGSLALSAAVLAIMITAPLGALAIDLSYSLCLHNEKMEGVLVDMVLKNDVRTRFNPVLLLRKYCATFSEAEGTYECEICVHKGCVEFSHSSYNTLTGGWDDRPDSSNESRRIIREGESLRFHFTREKHDGQLDSIVLSNHAYLRPAEFTFKYERSHAE